MIDAPIGLAGSCWLLICVLALAGKLPLRVAPIGLAGCCWLLFFILAGILPLRVAPYKLGTRGRAFPLPALGSPPVVGLADAVPLPSVCLGSPAIVRLAKGFVKCSPLFAGISSRLADGFGLN